ncbi:unnamed protein product [Rhizophagus irregularis]|nr:unnamed protein product [Rhizophagus irregularis]
MKPPAFCLASRFLFNIEYWVLKNWKVGCGNSERFKIYICIMYGMRVYSKGNHGLDDDDPTKIVYLRVKAFIPIDENIPCQIEDFNKGQVIFLKGKFVACASWYSTPPPLAIMVIPSVRKTKALPEYATTPPTISYDEFE